MKTKRAIALGVALGALWTLGSAPAAHASHLMRVRGEYVEVDPVYTYDPTTGVFSGVGVSTVNGDWTGVFVERYAFRSDLITGNVAGTSLLTFAGTAIDGSTGTMEIAVRFTVDGANYQLHSAGSVIRGTGDWTGVRGRFSADGLSMAGGFGTWRANWVRP